MKRAIITALIILIASMLTPVEYSSARAQTENPPVCPIVLPQGTVRVSPNQPEVVAGSTVGIINALCEVTLNFVGCGFMPTEITISCDTNGDGVSDSLIPLKNITLVNANLVQATLAPLTPHLPGTPFPLTCCGGVAKLTLTRRIGAGDDNVFGDVTNSITCNIDLGLRAPVIISVTPSDGNCAVAQNTVISGACFVQADGKPNVTEVFAVERSNPANIVPSEHFVILSPNLIDALFDFGLANSGKVFLIYARGPNGTSRNLRIAAEAPDGCVLGNEQGVQVAFTCPPTHTPPGGGSTPPPPSITGCRVTRSDSGVVALELTGQFNGAETVTINGVSPKKIKFKTALGTGKFGKMVLKGRVCGNLPGVIVVTDPGNVSYFYQCAASCQN